jgi:hypothetical protein
MQTVCSAERFDLGVAGIGRLTILADQFDGAAPAPPSLTANSARRIPIRSKR